MKKLILLSLLLCAGFKGYPQTSTYQGAFRTGHLSGNASYHYNQGNNERIFEGPFQFISEKKSFKATGQYKGGLKEGEWNTLLSHLKYEGLNSNIFIDAKITGRFAEGKRTGLWSIAKTRTVALPRKGVFDYYRLNSYLVASIFKDTPPTEPGTFTINERTEASFKQNHFIGEFSANFNNSLKINGQFNDRGHCNGSWIVEYSEEGIPKLLQINFVHGVISTIAEYDASMGSLTSKYKNDFDLKAFFESYDPVTKAAVIDKKVYVLNSRGYTPPEVDLLLEILKYWNTSDLHDGYYSEEVAVGMKPEDLFPVQHISLDEEKTEVLQQIETENTQQLAREKHLEEQKLRQQNIELQREKKEFEDSALGNMQREIKTRFDFWLKRGEFEAGPQYTARLEQEAPGVFEKITHEVVAENKKRALPMASYLHLGTYNVKTQSFPLQDPVYRRKLSLPVPLQLAAALKERISEVGSQFNSHIYLLPLKVELKENDWELSEALVIFDFVTQQLDGDPSQYFEKNSRGDWAFSYQAIRRNGKIYPKEGDYYANNIRVKLVPLEGLEKIKKNENFLFTYWSTGQLSDGEQTFEYEIQDGESFVFRK